MERFLPSSALEWVLIPVAAIAVSAALVALGLVLGRAGVAATLLGGRLARLARGVAEDLLRALGGAVVALLLLPVAAGRAAILSTDRAKDALVAARGEAAAAARALYRAFVRRPVEFLGLGATLDGVEARLPAALDEGAAGASPRTGRPEFPGYRVLREMRRGGSGARLFVCEPDERTRRRIGLAEGYVVVKSFDFDEGTHLAEMLRESRSLDSARKLGLVLDHEASERRFHYVMRFHEGLDLGTFARRMHDAAGADPLDRERTLLLAELVRDVVATLRDWHAAGLWHKDIKPENVIVHEGRATLVDLGLVTPLASQMTLTTHGTEYYRDPELVRQAMRGARVSDVDAARFDVYGAGALLYFALEGMFPAHGVLSGFTKPSPESLRWIARRAMADFERRYPSAEEMLRDLDHAILGGNPAAVRPADLPSMRANGEAAAAGSEEAVFAGVAPKQPRRLPPPPDARLPARPKLRVVNWWTGAYEVVSIRPLPAALPAREGRGIAAAIAVLVASLVALGAVVAIWVAFGSN